MRLGRLVLFALTFCCAQPGQSLAAPGDPDPSFQGGVVRFNGPEAWGLALTPAGEPVVAGHGIVHLRLAPDGRPAAGYGGGPVRAPFDRYEYARASSVAAQPDGKVVIGGRVSRPAGSYPQNLFLRYLPDGRLDPTFGDDGIVFHDLTPDRTTVEEVLDTVIDPAGRIVFLGEVGRAPVIGRLLPDGRLDTSFAGGFVPVGNVKGFSIEAYDIEVTPDGGVLAIGMDSDPVLLRLTADGALDTSFGDAGATSITLTRRDAGAFNLALSPDGTFLVSGKSLGFNEHDNRFWAMRFTGNGRVDPRFGGPDGVSTTIPAPPRDPESPPTHREGGVNDAVVRADGKVVLVGSHGMVLQLLPDGAVDSSFGGGDGIALLADAGQLEDVALQPDGKIVVSQRSGFVVWRLQGDGQDAPPTGPGADPAPASPDMTSAPDPAPQPFDSGIPDAFGVTSADTPARAPENRVAPVSTRPVVVAVNRRGVARVPIVCPARGRCAGIVRVRVNGRIADQRRFSFRTGTVQRRVTIRLNARTRKLLRRDTQIDARVTVQIGRHHTHQSVTLTA